MTRRVRALVCVLALTMTAGCGSDSDGSEEGKGASTTSTTEPPVQNFTHPAQLEIVIGGHLDIHYEGKTTLNFLRAKGAEDVRILTLGTYQGGVQTGDWTIHEAFMSLVHYEGNGRYEIKPPPPNSGKQGMVDNAYTVVSRATPDDPRADAARYDVLVKRCVAEIERNGLEGELECEGLKDEAKGNVVTLTMRWSAYGEPTDLLAGLNSTTTTGAPTATTVAGGPSSTTTSRP